MDKTTLLADVCMHEKYDFYVASVEFTTGKVGKEERVCSVATISLAMICNR